MSLENQAPSLLIIDDDEQLSEILSLTFEADGFIVHCCDGEAAALRFLRETDPALILLDLRLGEVSGLSVLPKLREISPKVPIFMITAHGDVDSAVEAFRLGVTGYIRKPFQEGELKAQVSQAIEDYQLKQEVSLFRKAPSSSEVRNFIRSRDPAMDPLIRRTGMAAQVPSSVVIQGESGTGKELVARSLHFCGPRKNAPFVAFNCAALPESLLESELFGHIRGAFTDARESKPGLFVQAQKGSLFLDEIGDAPLSIQAKLLRVLQEREVLPVGSSTPVKIDVRVIAASHRSLKEEVARGTFRQDLFYRLHVIPLEIPPLRDRPKDILFLASLFALELATKIGTSFDGFSPAASQALLAHAWPGNVRELQNRIEYALALSKGGALAAIDLFPENLITQSSEPERVAPEDHLLPLAFSEAKSQFEQNYLKQLLAAASGNVAQAARLASKSRTEVYSLLKKHGLDPKSAMRSRPIQKT
ncbi:sigma-54 dependent transcriptional regulator [Bdellovibrionota bacterium FG-2]